MKKSGFYIIKEQFFEDMNEPYLKGNKKENRPHYYCFEDENTGIYWMIPLSSKIEKYRKGRSVEPQYQRMNLLKSIAITLLCYYIVIATCGESSAITIHIFLLSIAMVYSNLIGEKEEIGL